MSERCPSCGSDRRWSEATAVAAINNGRANFCMESWHWHEGVTAAGATQPPDANDLDLAVALHITYCNDLADEGQPWEVPAEPEPRYFATLKEAIVFLVNLGAAEREARARTEGWIPVKARLPKPITDVLIVVQRFAWSNSGKSIQPEDNWVQIGALRPDGIWIDDNSTIGTSDERKYATARRSEYRLVTHWMPLPEPPSALAPGVPTPKGD